MYIICKSTYTFPYSTAYILQGDCQAATGSRMEKGLYQFLLRMQQRKLPPNFLLRWQLTARLALRLTLMGWISAYGGFPSAISMAVIPRDQMSATQLYPIS